jgi:hypothetical protein
MSLFRNWFKGHRPADPPPPPPPMMPALHHWPRARAGVPCAACTQQYQTAHHRFDAVVANNTFLTQENWRINSELDGEMEFMTEGTFGRDSESRVSSRCRYYETGKWTDWKGWGRRCPPGAQENRYVKWWIEPTNTYRVEGPEAAKEFQAQIAAHGLPRAVQNLSQHPTRTYRPQLVTIDWLLSPAEARSVRARRS